MAELLRIGYGKEAVSVYRTDGVSTLFAAEVGMTARGEAFVPSYTEGDNAVVVATDSMKNFIHMTALEYEEASLEDFLELLAEREDPLGAAPAVIEELTDEEKRGVLDAHPAIGQRSGLSARSAAEQGADADPEVLAELARLNAEYEARHGFRFVVFVDRRPKAEILEILRVRIDNPTDAELETALRELVAIATDRWQRS